MRIIEDIQYQFFNISTRVYFGNTGGKKDLKMYKCIEKATGNGAGIIFYLHLKIIF